MTTTGNGEHMTYTDVMFDIETLGTSANAPILSIAAVPFSPDGPMPKTECFHRHISLREEVKNGAVPNPDTFLWWLGQSSEAVKGLLEGQKGAGNPAPVALALTAFLREHTDLKTVRVWGNGASFDPVLLAALYGRCQLPLPWTYRNVRCYRTLLALFPSVQPVKTAVLHDGLEDAYAQALTAIRLLELTEAR